ncbi:MAG: hypothetical protein AAGD01_04690 [Acidobacteriota bacterium]
MSDPRERCKAQLFRRLRGQKTAPETMRRFLGSLETWNQGPGSQNWPRVARVATGDWRWLVQLAEKEKEWGFWSREFGSLLYTADGLVATMAALREARRASRAPERDTEQSTEQQQRAVASLTSYLRATWTLLALSAQPTPKTTTFFNLRGKVEVGKGDRRFYRGPSLALAGNRNHASNVGQDILGALLGWSLNWPGRLYRRPIVDGMTPGEVNGYTWPLKIVEELLGQPYGAEAPPEPFGLSAVDREHLIAHVQDGDRAADLLEDISPWPIYPGDGSVTFTIRRTTEGTQSWLSRTFNPNKPGFPVATLTPAGSYTALQPNRWRRESSPPATVEERDGVLLASAEGSTLRQPLLGGEELYRIEWGKRPRRVLPRPSRDTSVTPT